jgi:hypothetical protein
LGGFAFGSTASSRLSPKPRNCGKRQPGAGSFSLIGLSSMSVSRVGRSWVTIEDAGIFFISHLRIGIAGSQGESGNEDLALGRS